MQTMESVDKQALADQTLTDVVNSARAAFGEALVAAVVFGSAANGQLRVTSDVNLMLVLTRFNPQQANEVRESVRLARALVDMHVMFIVQDELPVALKSFPVKFSDIISRHKLLFGVNPFENSTIPIADLISHTKQALLNFQLRTREQYVLVSLREEQLVNLIADSAAPLRSCAAALRQIRGESYLNSKEALEQFVSNLQRVDFKSALNTMSQAREQGFLPAGNATKAILALLDLSHVLYEQL
jgi:predicted nucleotidyltransferase